MLIARKADICSKCLVTEPVVRSFMFSRSYVVATALRGRWGKEKRPDCRLAEGPWPQDFLTSVTKLNLFRRAPWRRDPSADTPDQAKQKSGANKFSRCCRRGNRRRNSGRTPLSPGGPMENQENQ